MKPVMRGVVPPDDAWAGLLVPSEHRPRLSFRPVPDEFEAPASAAPLDPQAPLAPPSRTRSREAAKTRSREPRAIPDGPRAAADLQSPPLGVSGDGAEALESVQDRLCAAVAGLLHERLLPVIDERLRAALAEELPPVLHAAMGVPLPDRTETCDFRPSVASCSTARRRAETCDSSPAVDGLCLAKVRIDGVSEVATTSLGQLKEAKEPSPEPMPARDMSCISDSCETQPRYTKWENISKRMTSLLPSFKDRTAIVGAKVQHYLQADHPIWDALPLETSCIACLVDSYPFGFGISALVILNSIHLGIVADHQVRDKVSHESYDPDALWLETVFDSLFVWLFFVEVSLRIYAERRIFFFGLSWRWSIFDLVLLALSLLEKYGGFPHSFSFLRKLRMLRLIRVLHVLQHVESLEVLRQMISSIMRSAFPIIWVVVVFILLVYMFSLFFAESIVDHMMCVEDVYGPDSAEVDVNSLAFRQHYGTLGRVMISLFMAISGGDDWGNVIDPLWRINWISPAVFMAYLVFMVFAVVNIVTGIFVEQAMEVAEVDREKMLRVRVKAMHELAREIKVFFKEMDEDGSQTLSWEEFERHLSDPRIAGYFELLGIDPSSAKHVFILLDNETHKRNSVPINAFIDGCMRFRGSAKSVDVALLMMECHKQKDELRALAKYIHRVL